MRLSVLSLAIWRAGGLVGAGGAGDTVLTISGTPPVATSGIAYSWVPTVSGGTPPYSFAVTSGALPTGLSINAATGSVSGTPSSAATFTFTVTVSQVGAISGDLATSVTVNSAAPTVAGSPTIGTATAGNASAIVAFTAPASNGGATITAYRVTSSPGGITSSAASSPISVSGLANGTSYTFTVAALNSVGYSAESAASSAVTPAGASFTPASLFTGGFQGAYWDTSNLSSMAQNSDGTVAAVVGQPVGYIADLSGNSRHMVQATAAARPTLRMDGLGNHYLEFDGVDDTVTVPLSLGMFNFLHDGTGGSVFHALRVGSDSANTNTMGNSVNNAHTGIRFVRHAASDGVQYSIRNSVLAGNVALLTGGTNLWPVDAAVIPAATYISGAGTAVFVYLNGALVAEGPEGSAPASGDAGRTFGMPLTTTMPSHWYGGLAISKVLTAGERGSYESWLAARCGVTL